MTEPVIERVDELPLLIYWLLKMRVHEIIDRILPHPHPNRQGLSYGQLALLFVAYVVYQQSHRLCEMEDWVAAHHWVLHQATGWEIGPKEATDDRLGDLLSALGADPERGLVLQRELGQHLIQAYALPTEVGRFDTTTFTVHHAPGDDGQAAGGILSRGHSKDRRPDLLQFKQGLGALDPAGVPIFTGTWSGNSADDPLYLPAWQEMSQTLGRTDFLFVADCKAAALLTRAEIAHRGGYYLFPMPMTGKVPEQLRTWVLNPPTPPQPVVLEQVLDAEGQPRQVGRGFVVERQMTATLTDGQEHTWTERWLVTRSDSLAQRRQKALLTRLEKAETELTGLNAKGFSDAAELEAATQKVLHKRRVADLLTVAVTETVTQEQRLVGPGRPGPNRPTKTVDIRQLRLTVSRNQTALDEQLQVAGWRIHVTNVPAVQMTLNQAIAYYRDEFLVEHGFHRFKGGSLPALPLFLRLPERIVGLMLLLLIALQVLTLLEFVARRTLAQQQATLAGLVPGNPKMKTARPTAERMLARFKGIHFLGQRTETHFTGRIVEALTPVQRQILALLEVPETIYTADLCLSLPNYLDSS